jgi:DNA polymerase I-like protein with 3'-5' exonuclease and polymerase domains
MGPRKFTLVLRGDGIYMPEAEAKGYQDTYLARFSGIPIYHQLIEATIRKTRTLRDLNGREHVFLGLFDDATFREAYSRIPQATVAGVMKRAMIKLYHDLFTFERYQTSDLPAILIQVHDSLEVECDVSQVDQVLQDMQAALEIPLTVNGKTFTIPAEFKVGTRWDTDMQKVRVG